MTKRKFDAAWYAGSVREKKREAYLAGAEASLDITMKTLDREVKRIIGEEPMPDSVKAAFSLLQLKISTKVYESVIRTCMVKTPFDPPLESTELLETEREPGLADRTSK